MLGSRRPTQRNCKNGAALIDDSRYLVWVDPAGFGVVCDTNDGKNTLHAVAELPDASVSEYLVLNFLCRRLDNDLLSRKLMKLTKGRHPSVWEAARAAAIQ